jgi:hypothetical protein
VGTDIKWDTTCDRNLSEVFAAIQSGVHDPRIPGRQGRVQPAADGLADGVQYEMPEEDDGYGGGGRRRRRRGGRRRRRGGDDDDEEDEEDEDESEDGDNAEDAAILGILNEALKDGQGHSIEGREIIEKVTIIVQNMTRPASNKDGRRGEEDAGCVIFFCIHDELYSMGTPFQTLIKLGADHRMSMSRQRKAQGRSGGGGGGHDGQGPGGRQQFNRELSLVERFPFLRDGDHFSNTLLNFTSDSYLDLAAFITNDPSMVREHRQRNLNDLNRLRDPGTESNPNLMHPALLFNTEWALGVMRLYGVPSRQASMDALRGGPGWLESLADEALKNGVGVERWYFDPERSYHYLMAGFVWARLGSAGLESQYFPWFKIPAPLLKSTMARSASNALVRYEADSGANKLAPAYASAMIIPDLGRPEVLPTKFYDPNVISRRNGIRQVCLDNIRMMNTLTAPADPIREPRAYELYCDMMAEYREACLTNMVNVLKPSNHIYPSMNAILTWMASEMRLVSVPLAHFTVDPYDTAPVTWPLDQFANYMIRMGLSLKNDLFLAARADRWILVHHAHNDCHATMEVKMHPSALVHGPSEGGKSHLFDSALSNSAIPDTVVSILESSDKAYYVHEDSLGLTIQVHEAPKIWVDAKLAAADKSGAAERIKSMTTEHKATYRTLVLIEGANGRSERRAETIESQYHATLWVCTNGLVSHGDEAIASRFFNFVMTGSESDLFEYAGLGQHLNDDDRNRKADCLHAWRIKQALISLSLVLIDSKILPRPSMDVFDHLHTRVLAYFKEQGVNTAAIRKVDMVGRVAAIYTLLNGLICLYDNPGAKYAGKEFELSQLMDLIPYLYCTKQIAVFTMTQTEEVFLNPLRSAVLRGIMHMAKIPYVRGKTIEEYFKEDTTRSLAGIWRREETDDRGTWFDFNYIALSGLEFKDIYANIAECCDIKVEANEVENVLHTLSGNKSGYLRVRRVQPLRGDFYFSLQPDAITRYTGLTRERDVTSLQIVKRDHKNKTLLIATEAINKLHDDMLVDAFQHCMYPQWQPQELLTAYEVRKQNPVDQEKDQSYVGLFDVMRITSEVVEEFSQVEAFTAPNVAYLTPTTQKMMSGPRLHPDKRGESYAPRREKRESSTTSIREDLDVFGHRQHHYRAGCRGKPEKSPSHPNILRETIRAALQQNEDYHEENDTAGIMKHVDLLPRCLQMQYPHTIIDELDDHLRQKRNARPFGEMNVAKQKVYEMEVQDWIKGGKQGPVPVMTTLTNMARVVRADYRMAELGGPLNGGGDGVSNGGSGGANGVGRLGAPVDSRLGRKVRGSKQTFAHPVTPSTTNMMVKDPLAMYAQQKARKAARIEQDRLRELILEAAQATGYGPRGKRGANTWDPSADYTDIDSLMPAGDVALHARLEGRQVPQLEAPPASTPAAAAAAAVVAPAAPAYEIVDGLVVLPANVRATKLRRTESDRFASLSSSSSSAVPAADAATGAAKTKGPSHKKQKKKLRTAAEKFDDITRTILEQNASTGYDSVALLCEVDKEDSRSRLMDDDDNVQPPSTGAGDDYALDAMDGFD